MLKLKNDIIRSDERGQKGYFGEEFVKLFLEQKGIKIEHSANFLQKIMNDVQKPIIKKKTKKLKSGAIIYHPSKKDLEQIDKEYSKIATKKYGTTILPDFRILNKKIYIEVKVGKAGILQKEQRESFEILMKNGFKIIIAIPDLIFKDDYVYLKGIKWQLYEPFKKREVNTNISQFIKISS